jgi:hypothetical protein
MIDLNCLLAFPTRNRVTDILRHFKETFGMDRMSTKRNKTLILFNHVLAKRAVAPQMRKGLIDGEIQRSIICNQGPPLSEHLQDSVDVFDSTQVVIFTDWSFINQSFFNWDQSVLSDVLNDLGQILLLLDSLPRSRNPDSGSFDAFTTNIEHQIVTSEITATNLIRFDHIKKVSNAADVKRQSNDLITISLFRGCIDHSQAVEVIKEKLDPSWRDDHLEGF